MWELICECISQASPQVKDILKSIREHNICTNTQCFETMQDAGFGHYHNAPQNPNLTFFTMICAIFVMLLLNRPSNLLTNKPQLIVPT